MAGELDQLGGWELQNILKLATDAHQNLFAFLRGAAFATSYITITTVWDALSNSPGPDTNTVESFPDINDDAHKFSIIFFLECFTDCGEHNMKPELVDRDVTLLSEGVRPLSAVLILHILPFWPNTLFEEMVVRFES